MALFEKGGSVRFAVRALELLDKSNDRVSIRTDPPIHLFLLAQTIKIRQGMSLNSGKTRAFFTVSVHTSDIKVLDLDIGETSVFYSFSIPQGVNVEKASDVTPMTMRGWTEPSEFSLAQPSFTGGTIVRLELEQCAPTLWEKYSEIIRRSLLGNTFVLAESESTYLKSNNDAVIHEAKNELEALTTKGCQVEAMAVGRQIILEIWPSEDRPLRLYTGCTLILRGKGWFSPASLKSNQKGHANDWMATVTESSQKWCQLASPVHAVLLNSVNIASTHRIVEEGVEVYPLCNPAVEDSLVVASNGVPGFSGFEEFNKMCRDFEFQGASFPQITSESIPLRSIFLHDGPVINTSTYEPLVYLSEDPEGQIPTAWNLNQRQKEAVAQCHVSIAGT